MFNNTFYRDIVQMRSLRKNRFFSIFLSGRKQHKCIHIAKIEIYDKNRILI